MGLVYDENAVYNGKAFDITKFNPNNQVLKHYENSLYLTFMLQHGTMIERHQASKEMAICERKMAFWKRDHRYSHEQFVKDAAAAKRKWAK